MKKMLLTAAFAVFAMSAFAQPGQGSLYVGGSLGFSSKSEKSTVSGTTTDGDSKSDFSIRPTVGYFVTDNISAGLMLLYFSETTTTPAPPNGQETKVTGSGIGIAPFARYHMMGDGDLHFFGQLDIPITSGTTKTTVGSASAETDNSSFGVNVRPGLMWFPTESIGIEATIGALGFSSTKAGTNAANKDDVYETSSFGLNLSTALGFGFNWYF